ncbi:antibiotic biosynthesis monooxygenase family protein [Rhodoferax sp.]|uniref:antibiotic biosynthesis monooxygenase family protein n=1 Tax=Rhodoferax sp. TaxID=50421 RepID=UPI0025E3DDC1|nr:antibiotic biosynthesis monooxygenase family protein [Rhodoferax sp.]MCM2339713.1 antibiotic biosynthesis monooxygenase [Rhodoferax sp.]
MILEVADIRVKTGQQVEFENAVKIAMTTVFTKAKGFREHNFHRCIESPDRYVLQLTWDTLEDHTVEFRGSPLFTEWRSLVGSFFAQPPQVEHFELVSRSDTKPGVA